LDFCQSSTSIFIRTLILLSDSFEINHSITDLTLGYDFTDSSDRTYNAYLTVNNLFDEAPQQTPGNGFAFFGGTSGVNGLYDAIGRRYAIGVNVSF
jgi:outer membrane receptor protein involved in Fe transport